MNASRLREVIDLLLNLENKFQIQNLLNELKQHLDSMVQQPQQPQFQSQFSQTLTRLQTASELLRQTFEPAQIAFLDEIGASEFFVNDLSAQISDWMQKNPLTPVVIQTNLNDMKVKRQNYIDNITKLRDSLEAIGVKASVLKPGDAEIGILLPRSLFENNFELLIKELSEFKLILRAFSERATGTAEPIEVRQISTSDPLFFLGMRPETIAMVAGAVAWALHTWKQVEEIRKVRAETSKLTMFSEEEVKTIFGVKIEDFIEEAVSEKLDALLTDITSETGRPKEQRANLKHALDSLLARIERGVTIQVRFLPPPPTTQEDGTPSDIPQEFKTLQEITPQLVFAKIEGTPILQLPDQDQTKGTKG